MGLFGFVVSVIGLGAVTKDAISDSIYTSKNYREAITNGKPYYSGSGSKMYATKTGKRCSYDYDYSKNHNVLTDLKTGEVVEDLTALDNNKKTLNAKRDIHGTGCVFYRTYEFDDQKHRSHNIYKSTKMDGYFTKVTIDGVDRFEKCDVVYDDILGYRVNNISGINDKFFADGTHFSREKDRELRQEYQMNRDIKKGKVIFPYKDEYVEGFKDINTGELYVNYEYYQPEYKSYPKKKLINVYGREYKKAKMIPGKDIKYFCKKFVLVPVEGSKTYNDHGIEIVR